MSARLLALWLDQPADLAPHLRPLMHVLAHHASVDDHEAWPAVDTLAGELGRSGRTVQRGLRELEEGCYLSVLYVAGGRGRSSRWRVHTPLERQALLAERRRIKGDTGVTVSQAERVTPVSRKGDTGVANDTAPSTRGVERGIERAPDAAGPGEGPASGAEAGGEVLAGAFPGSDDGAQLALPTDPRVRALVERARDASRRREAREAAQRGAGQATEAIGVDSSNGAR